MELNGFGLLKILRVCTLINWTFRSISEIWCFGKTSIYINSFKKYIIMVVILNDTWKLYLNTELVKRAFFFNIHFFIHILLTHSIEEKKTSMLYLNLFIMNSSPHFMSICFFHSTLSNENISIYFLLRLFHFKTIFL